MVLKINWIRVLYKLNQIRLVSDFNNLTYLEFFDQIKNKLSYEWKNVYRQLNSADVGESGVTNKK